MTEKKVLLESLAMDLKRVALGLHRGSFAMAERFKFEAIKRGKELEGTKVDHYLKRLLIRYRKVLANSDERAAEDALMLSILFQNLSRS